MPRRRLLRPLARALTLGWPPRSRLFLVGEGAGWAIDYTLAELARVADRLDLRLADRRVLLASRGQAAFFGSHFTLLQEPWRGWPHALGTAYFHGRPGTPGMPEFDLAYRALQAHHRELERVRVTHREMEELVLSTGIDAAKVRLIRLGVDLSLFSPRTAESREAARRELGLPREAFVVGSFQKDGVGWEAGDEPKAIKGPDVLLDALARARDDVPELHVLLSGPARGFVRAGLERLGIPYVHRLVAGYDEIPRLYAALDAYVVPARQEGGPMSVLEAMACGVPVVSTRVGQAAELIRDGVNGRLVEVEDAEALAAALAGELTAFVEPGFDTARENGHDAQLPLWESFFDGFVGRA